MLVGVRLPNAGPKATPANIMAVARWAHRLGYHSMWVTDRVLVPARSGSFYPYGTAGQWNPSTGTYVDPLISLTWANAIAPELQLGTSVLVAPLRNPVLLAKQFAALDFLSGGRVICGLGVGWMKEEFAGVGVPYEERGRRATEMVQLMRMLWTGDEVDFHGRYWQISGCRIAPRPVQPAIPVIWGGHSDATLRRVARIGDGWHPTRINIPELKAGLEKLRSLCEKYGRDPQSVPLFVRPGDVYTVTPETHAQHLELGVTHLIIDTPVDDPSIENVHQEMERVAEVCSLRPRTV